MRNNRRIEVNINTNLIRSGNFNWNLNFNVSHNASKVIKPGDQDWQLVNVGHLGLGQGYLKEGMPIGNWYGYIKIFYSAFSVI